jgi:hypothetical protein
MKTAVRGAGDGLTINLTTITRNAACISPARRKVPDLTIHNSKICISDKD